MELNMSAPFGQWLKERRKALDLTQAEFATLIHCSTETIRKFEAGQRRPSREIAELLAATLAVPIRQWGTFIQCARVGQIDPLLLSTPRQHFPSYPNHNLPDPPTPLIGRE